MKKAFIVEIINILLTAGKRSVRGVATIANSHCCRDAYFDLRLFADNLHVCVVY